MGQMGPGRWLQPGDSSDASNSYAAGSVLHDVLLVLPVDDIELPVAHRGHLGLHSLGPDPQSRLMELPLVQQALAYWRVRYNLHGRMGMWERHLRQLRAISIHQPAAEAIVASVAAKHDRRVASLMLAMDACEAAAMA